MFNKLWQLGVVVSVVGALAAPSVSFAVGQGRIFGVVSDEKGTPVAGVVVTVTTTELEKFKVETTTDDKGKYAFTLKDATLTYNFTLTKPGFQTLEHREKIPLHSNTQRNLTIKSEAASAAEAQAASAGTAAGVFNEGATAAQAGDYPTAIAKFQEALVIDPNLAPAYGALAAIYLEQSKFAESAEMADKAVALAPGNARSQRIRYEAHRTLGNTEKAAEAKAALETLDPKGAVISLVNQGIEAFNAGDIPKATAALEEAVTLDDKNVKGLFTLGLCYVNAGDSAKAKATFEKYLAVAPADDADLATAKEMLSYL